MTESRTHEYFDRKSSEWSITGFLEECEVESLELKIDRYLKSLEDIIKYERLKGHKPFLIDIER